MAVLARRADPVLTSLNYVVCCLLSESRGGALSFLLGKLGLFTSCCSFRTLSATNCNPQPTKCTMFFLRCLDHIITLSIPACFSPQGIIIREQVSNNTA